MPVYQRHRPFQKEFDDGGEERGIDAEQLWSTLKNRERPVMADFVESGSEAERPFTSR